MQPAATRRPTAARWPRPRGRRRPPGSGDRAGACFATSSAACARTGTSCASWCRCWRRIFRPAAGAAAAGAAARARPRRRDADDRAAAGRRARSDDGQRRRGDQALLPQPGDPVGVPQPAPVHLRAGDDAGSDRPVRAARRDRRTTCCRPFTATRSTIWCCCARTRAASRRWRAQARQIVDGTHPHQRALASLIEDGAYHARLPRDIAAFQADPHEPARPIPPGLVDEPDLMLAMDQFKDVRGFARYASRLRVGFGAAIAGLAGGRLRRDAGRSARAQARTAARPARRLRPRARRATTEARRRRC